MKKDDPHLIRMREALGKMYGDRLDRVILFGSQARGDARPDSDYDLAIFLKDMPDRWAELDKLAVLHLEFLQNNEPFFDLWPYHASKYQDLSSPIMHEIRREGVEI